MTDWYSEVTKGAAPAAPPAASTDWYAEVTGKSDAASVISGPKTDEPYSGSILPFSRDEKGNTSFDSNAGILGALKRAFLAPGDAYTGKISPFSVEGQDRAREAATVMTPARAGSRAAFNRMQPKEVPIPTAEELKAASSQGYKAARDTGASYPAESVKAMVDGIRSTLETDGIIAELSPKTFSIIGKLQGGPDGSVATIAGLDAARKALGRAAGDFGNPTEQEAARRVIKEIDKFIMGRDPARPVDHAAAAEGALTWSMGPPSREEAAAKLITEARGNTAALKRSERVTGAQERAELNAAVANSGQNLDNAIRQRLRDILVRPKEARGFNSEELALLESIARGSPSTNALRFTGNLMGGGGGLGAVVSGGLAGATAGALGSGPMGMMMGAGVPALGFAAKKGASAMTQRGVNQLDELIRMRSPLYEKRAATPGLEAEISPDTLSLIRLLFAPQDAPQP